MKDLLKQRILELEPELIALRRDIHENPELGTQEFRTSALVRNYLEGLGMFVQTVSGTGVVALLQGQMPGKTLLLRADLDGLSQEEQNSVSYRSKRPGIMHACGHDGHTAMLLIAARILAERQAELKGCIKFVFQPNEEEAGALKMIQEGILENPSVDGAVAVHLWTPIASGRIGLAEGPVMAATEEFEITVMGQSGHTSTPHTAVDAVLAAAELVQALQRIQTREIDPLLPITIMVGSIHGGTGRNIIADHVVLGGTIRFMFPDESLRKKELLEKFERVIAGVCGSAGVTFTLKYIPSNPTLDNSPMMTASLRRAAEMTFGTADNIEAYRCMAGEDFAEFSQRVPSALYFLGTGNSDADSLYPHHHPRFNIDEATLKWGVEMHVRAALDFL